MANYGIKVSGSGSDVFSVTDKQARFTSKYGGMKVHKWGDVTITLDGSGNYTHTIAHDLGYAPAVDVFVKGTASYSYVDASSYSNAWFRIGGANRFFGQNDVGGLFCYSDADNIYIQAVGVFKSSTVYARYYLYLDPVQEYTGASNVDTTGDYGIKISKDGKSIAGKEYEMGFSSKYKSIQYYSESIKSETLTLPEMYASWADTDVEEATYVDFTHGLGYPPYFQAYFTPSSGILREIPFCQNDAFDGGTSDVISEVSAWCDSTRIRVLFYRRSGWLSDDAQVNTSHSASTITITVIPFAENLTGLDYGE